METYRYTDMFKLNYLSFQHTNRLTETHLWQIWEHTLQLWTKVDYCMKLVAGSDNEALLDLEEVVTLFKDWDSVKTKYCDRSDAAVSAAKLR